MCGFVGFFQKGLKSDSAEPLISSMTQCLRHRGPDDEGVWVNKNIGLAMGHRRLSILDLSKLGHQPMISASKRFVMVYNGEVYNFDSIKNDLKQKGHSFKGSSDSEVILASFEEWGIESAVKKFIGMFTIALWDQKQETLSLIRDRLGIKPLYFGWNKNTFFFGSELKAFKKHPDFEKKIDPKALQLFLQRSAIPTPFSIYQNIYKSKPGTIVSVDFKNTERKWKETCFWSAWDEAKRAKANMFEGNEDQACDELDQLLKDAVKKRMVSDVPLGTFLSGGIDSSLVTALMQAQSSRPIKTFSIGFHEQQYNEAHQAKLIAEHLKTDHTEKYVTPSEARDVIPLIPQLYDEPFADSSQIPTYLVSKLAREQVTVSLSGDGGDELFGGYNRYFWGQQLIRWINRTPQLMRSAQSLLVPLLSPSFWDKGLKVSSFLLPDKLKKELTGTRIHRISYLWASKNAEELYERLISIWNDNEIIEKTYAADDFHWDSKWNDVENMMLTDSITYLPDDILTKVDRASMGVSLEARVPILDHRVFEWAWRLPFSMKVGDHDGKKLLKKLLYRYVPQSIVDRPKMGFGVPIDSWLKGPLREWAESLLSPAALKEHGFLNSKVIKKRWDDHQSGRRNGQYHLWTLLVFQQWFQSEKSN